jgi:hypothetical protein
MIPSFRPSCHSSLLRLLSKPFRVQPIVVCNDINSEHVLFLTVFFQEGAIQTTSIVNTCDLVKDDYERSASIAFLVFDSYEPPLIFLNDKVAPHAR